MMKKNDTDPWNLAKELEAKGLTMDEAHYYWQLAEKVMDSRRRLLSLIGSVEERMAVARAVLLNRGVPSNSLGILQSLGTDLDVEAMKLDEANHTLGRYVGVLIGRKIITRAQAFEYALETAASTAAQGSEQES
jgi:hypothetical protein